MIDTSDDAELGSPITQTCLFAFRCGIRCGYWLEVRSWSSMRVTRSRSSLISRWVPISPHQSAFCSAAIRAW